MADLSVWGARRVISGRLVRCQVRARKIPLKGGGTVTLRQGRVADAVGLLACVNAVAAEGRYYINERLEVTMAEEHKWIRAHDGGAKGLLVVVISPEGEVVGNMSVSRSRAHKAPFRAELGLGLMAPYRGQGVGRALLEEAVRWSRGHGIKKLTLQVFSSNTRARALYESFGFREDGVNHRHYKVKGRYVDNVNMALWL